MRQLLGKIPIKHRSVLVEIYLTEHVRCQTCQTTAPVGIEVVTFRKEGQSKERVRHCWYCRAHGAEYAAKTQG